MAHKLEYLPLSQIRPATRNPKEHAYDTIRESINRFGFTQPLLLDEQTGKLVAGHGRLKALLEMKNKGEKPPKGIIANNGNWKVPVVRGLRFKDTVEAEAYLLADNQTTILGGWDEKVLQDMLKDHTSALQGMGFKPSDIEALAMPWPDPGEGAFTKREDTVLQTAWVQTPHVEEWLKTMVKGHSLNVCCGMSTIGDVRLDKDAKSNRTEEGDLYKLTYKPGSFDTVVCDPPFQYYDTLKVHRGCKWLVRLSEIAKQRLLVSSPAVALNNLLPRFKPSLYALADAKKPYFLRLYWCFDRQY